MRLGMHEKYQPQRANRSANFLLDHGALQSRQRQCQIAALKSNCVAVCHPTLTDAVLRSLADHAGVEEGLHTEREDGVCRKNAAHVT